MPVWTDTPKVDTDWTDSDEPQPLQGGSMIGFIISSNGVWVDTEKVTTIWTDT